MKPPIPPPPPIIIDLTSNQPVQPISVMAEEFISAFDDLQKDDSNNERLVDFVRSHYSSSLISPDFCSTLQRRLDTANENDFPPFFHHNFFCDDISRLVSDHSMIVNTLKPMNAGFNMELDSINISQKVSAVFFIAAVIICTAASAIATANANPEWAWAAVAGAATAAPVASILFGALGNWRYSVLCKSETAVRKHKEITTRMILAADCGIKDLINIHFVASRLEFETKSLSKTHLVSSRLEFKPKSLSETVDDSKKVAAVKSSSEELLKKVKNYNGEIKWVKQKVLDIIIKP